MPLSMVFFFLFFIGLVIFLGSRAYNKEKRLRDELSNYVTRKGFSISELDHAGVRDHLGCFSIRQNGWAQELLNVITADRGQRQAILFECVHRTGGYRYTATKTEYACTWQLPVTVGHLVIRPEHAADKVRDWFEGCDIDFSENKGFSDRFVVMGDDETEARRVVKAKVMDFLLSSDLQCLEIVGNLALLHGPGRLTADRCGWLLQTADGLDKVLADAGAQR